MPFIICFHFCLVLKCSVSLDLCKFLTTDLSLQTRPLPSLIYHENGRWVQKLLELIQRKSSAALPWTPSLLMKSWFSQTLVPQVLFLGGLFCMLTWIHWTLQWNLTNSSKYSPIKQISYFHWFRKASSIYYLGNILSNSSRWGMCGTGGLSKCKRVRNTDPAWARNLSIFSADCWASQHIICLQLKKRERERENNSYIMSRMCI